MKKVTIGILIIIPVIIMLVVSLVSVVVSANMHIGVEEVIISTNSVTVSISREVYDINDYLTTTVLPEKASNTTREWSISGGVSCYDGEYESYYEDCVNLYGEENAKNSRVAFMSDDEGNYVDSNNSGKFRVNASCSFTLECRVGEKSAYCAVIVNDGKLSAVAVKGANSLKENENILLSVELTPVDAITKKTEWISSDENVLTVDANGAVNAFKAGSATVIARVYTSDEEYIDSAPYEITVEKNVTLLGADVATHERRIALSAFGVNASDIINTVNCTIDGEYIVIADDKTEANFETANGVCTLTVTDGMQIKNKNLYAYDEERESFVFSVGDKLALQAVWKSAFKSDEIVASWSVDNDRVATVDGNGILSALNEGLVKVTVTVGAFSDEITINVRNTVASVIIDDTKKEFSKAGLALEYVIPTLRYKNIAANHDVVANYIDVAILLPTPPATDQKVFYDAFDFAVYENGETTDKAYFVSNRLNFNHDKVTEKTALTVKVSAKYPKFANRELSTDTVEIKVVNGVEASDFATLMAGTGDKLNVCVSADIEIDPTISTCDPVVQNSRGYYGNGFMLSAAQGQLLNTDAALMICNESNSFVSNGVFRANRTAQDVITADDTEDLQGTCIMYGLTGHSHGDYVDGNYAFLDNTRAEYCIFENAYNLFKIFTAETTIEGCIFRNAKGTGIFTPTEAWVDGDDVTVGYTKLTTRNIIMSNLTGMSLSLEYKSFLPDNPEKREELFAQGKNTFFKQEGFLDIYNWQSIDSMNLLPADVLGSSNAEVALTQGINAVLRDKLLDKSIEQYRLNYNRKQWFLIGFMSNGVKYPTYLECDFEDERITYVTSDILEGFENLLANPVYLYTYKNTVEDILPEKTYVINNKLIARLHGNY